MFLKFSQYPVPEPITIVGSSMTVQNLAPSLYDILKNSELTGEPIVGSRPLYDESEESGIARALAREADASEVFSHGFEVEDKPDEVATEHNDEGEEETPKPEETPKHEETPKE